MKKFFSRLLIILLPTFVLTGCWNLTEPEDISLVTVLGINYTDNNQYEVIAQDQTLTPGGQQIQKSNWTFDIHKATGSTIDEALQQDARLNPEKIYLSHTKAIVISEELASRRGIEPVVDFLNRNPEIRHNTAFLISKKGEFDKVFLPNAKLNIDTGKLIEKTIKNKNANSFMVESRLKEFLKFYWDSYTDPYALGVASTQTLVNNENIEQNYENVNATTYDISVGDIAVFRKDKMVGWLTGDESRGYLWVKGKVSGGSINVGYGGKQVDLKILNVKSTIKPAVKNNRMEMNVNIQVEANIAAAEEDANFDDKHVTEAISRVLDQQVTREVEEAIQASKRLSTDCFGFGNCFFENYPNYWRKNGSQWPDNCLQIDIGVHVSSNIQHIGLVKKLAEPAH